MENGVVNLVNAIDFKAFTLSICCLNTCGAMQDRITSGKTKIIVIGQKPGKAYALPLQLMALFRREQVDIIHTHNLYTGLYGIPAARLMGIPVIHGEHGFNYRLADHTIEKRNLEKLLCRLARHITCVSKQLERHVRDDFGIKAVKVSTIVNGVDYEKFSTPFSSDELRKELQVTDSDLVVGSVGRLHYQKNYQLLIKAISTLACKEKIKLLLVGDGPERQQLQLLAEHCGIKKNVYITGARDDVPDFLAIMDVFVLPSFLEGMSNTILEAMSAGLPVIASDVGGNPETVRDGFSGFLFQSDAEKDLREKIERLLHDKALRASMGNNAQAIVRNEFSIPGMVKRYERLYKRIAHTFGKTD